MTAGAQSDKSTRLDSFDRRVVQNYDYALQVFREIGYRQWRQYNPEETIRFYALRLHEVGMIKSIPHKILDQGTDWRLFRLWSRRHPPPRRRWRAPPGTRETC